MKMYLKRLKVNIFSWYSFINTQKISLDLMPPIFEGAKLSVTKMLSSHFQVSHTMTLTNGPNSGYKFGSNYVGTQLYTQSEV